MCNKIISFLSLVFVLGLAGISDGTTYYVSPSGNDNNTGTSTSQAWKTITKVNSVTFAAGDSILFEGGQTFSGQLNFDNEAGTPTSPITVSSYGTGRATLSNPTMGVEGSPSYGLRVYNTGGFVINNLILVGPGNVGDRWDENIGVFLHAHLGSGVRLDYIRINNVEVSNYTGRGVYVFGDNYSGFRDVEITNCVFHHIGGFGINTGSNNWPMNQSSHNDIYIADNTMYHITGVGARDPHSGNGIVLAAVDGALVEFNLAYSCGYNETSGGGGPLGMWCWETENVVFQFNEVHHQQTMSGDGGGFDLDGGTSFGTVQYCYSHDNFGGDLLMQFGRSRPAHDYLYRYNVNANQGQNNDMGAINFYTDTGGEPYNVEVYNNTIYVGPDAMPGASAIDVWYWKGGSYSNINIRNNIFLAEADKVLISYQKIGGFTFQNNVYWQSGEPLVIDAMGTLYTSLAAWRTGTGQEMLNGNPVGYQMHPQITDVHSRPVLGPHNLANLASYKLKSTSRCRDTGLNLQALFGINPGTRDFYGSSIPQGSLFDIGAQEYLGGGSAPAPDGTPPAAPTGLTATSTGAAISLDWANNGEADISHYSVKRSTTSGGPYTQIISNLNASAYTDRTVIPSTPYYYVVTATDTSSNQSGNSSQASATLTYPGSIIFSDGFESGNFTTGGWDVLPGGVSEVTTEAAYSGTYGATLNKHASIRKRLSTVGYTNIRIRYVLNTVNSTRWGASVVWWDGNGMHPVEHSAGAPWGLKDIICGPEADNSPDFYIMFKDNDPGPSERAFVDNVEIWGIGGGGGDTTPPSPNPMTWATAPYATGSTSIAMVATTATDVSGVQYFFDCTTAGGHDSAWQTGTSYTDTGLSPGTQYCYRVQARDQSVNQNTTNWSTTLCATTTQPDTTPPTPNPMTWSVLPYATGSTTIAMTATTATDASGVEYFFDETTGNPGGSDSAWQDSASYTDTGLSPGTMYTYRMQARDKSPNQNATGWSTSQSATTPTGGDTTPPTPNPMTWATVPYATGTTSIAMVATTATDASGVQYFFDCTSTGGHDSAWQSGTSYTDTGLSPNTQYCYRVQARDNSPNLNTTGWSSTQCATTQSGGGGSFFFDGFEDGSISDWTLSGSVSCTSGTAYEGTYKVFIKMIASMEKAVSTSGHTGIHLKFAARTNGFDAGEYVIAQWYDGSSWQTADQMVSQGSYTLRDITLPAGAANNPNFRIRLSTNSSQNTEWAYIDAVELTGQ